MKNRFFIFIFFKKEWIIVPIFAPKPKFLNPWSIVPLYHLETFKSWISISKQQPENISSKIKQSSMNNNNNTKYITRLKEKRKERKKEDELMKKKKNSHKDSVYEFSQHFSSQLFITFLNQRTKWNFIKNKSRSNTNY